MELLIGGLLLLSIILIFYSAYSYEGLAHKVEKELDRMDGLVVDTMQEVSTVKYQLTKATVRDEKLGRAVTSVQKKLEKLHKMLK